MMMMKFIECYHKKKIFYLNNFGNHTFSRFLLILEKWLRYKKPTFNGEQKS